MNICSNKSCRGTYLPTGRANSMFLYSIVLTGTELPVVRTRHWKKYQKLHTCCDLKEMLPKVLY